MSLSLCDAQTSDHGAILDVIRAAFPQEDLVPLVTALLDHDAVQTRVAKRGGVLCGMICWSICHVGPAKAALLGPLAVQPDAQRSGIGAALIRDGVQALPDQGVSRIVVLGDPAYYGRFGFVEETDVKAPYPLPDIWRTAWQGCALDQRNIAGLLAVPEPWRDAALWLP